MNTIGEMKDVYTVARYIGIPADKIVKFLNAAEMAGYVLVRKESLPQSAALGESKEGK